MSAGELYRTQINAIPAERLEAFSERELEVIAIFQEMSAGYANTPQRIKVDITEEEAHIISERLDELPNIDIDAVPESIRTAVRNNGGGHANHKLFWELLSPNGGGAPKGEVADAINSTFGSFEAFKEKFADAGAINRLSAREFDPVTFDQRLVTYRKSLDFDHLKR